MPIILSRAQHDCLLHIISGQVAKTHPRFRKKTVDAYMQHARRRNGCLSTCQLVYKYATCGYVIA